MIHKIKALHDNGNGLGIRAIARELDISRNTVRKYLAMPESEITDYLEMTERNKELDRYRDYLAYLLGEFPKMSAVKIQRKLLEKHPEVTVSSRSIRRYVRHLKQTIATAKPRYYEPILDMTPGVQCQVDPGELRGLLINGVERIVYFVVFVLSYSRMMYVGLSSKPINTDIFIRMHDAAFRYFGGMPEECIYDQTKLVVLHEKYREIEVNPRFNEYATHAGFRIHACEGYDPESKGKVEAGVKYVKNDGLYGESFASWSALELHVTDWLDTIANQRIHGTTGKQPVLHYEEEERRHMKAYFTPAVVLQGGQSVTRQADKTGLISWQANKYSVPLKYQGATIGVDTDQETIFLYDLETRDEIARHRLSLDKGQTVKNTNHYRDPEERIEALETEIVKQVGVDNGKQLCALLKVTSPKIYKDQLKGAALILRRITLSESVVTWLCERSRLTVRQMESLIEARLLHPERFTDQPEEKVHTGDLSRYQQLCTHQGTTHDLH